MFIKTFTLILILTSVTLKGQTPTQKPVRIAIAGMTHDHIGFILNRKRCFLYDYCRHL